MAKKNYVLVITQIPPFPVNVSNRILNNTELNEVKYPSYEWNQNEKKLQLDSMYRSLNSNKKIFVVFLRIFNYFRKMKVFFRGA